MKSKAFCAHWYGTRAQGICPFDFEGGICRCCPESVAAFGNAQKVPGIDGGCGDGASPDSVKEKGAFGSKALPFKKRTRFFIGWINDWFHTISPFRKRKGDKALKTRRNSP
jgi:hypothetical protein